MLASHAPKLDSDHPVSPSESAQHERRLQRLRTTFLEEPVSDRPEEITGQITHLKKLAIDSVVRTDQLGYEAIWSMLADEAFLRNVLARKLMNVPRVTDSTLSQEQFNTIYEAYADVLRHTREAPSEIATHIPPKRLLARVADLEAHHHLYLGESFKDETLHVNAYRHLWVASQAEMSEGKSAEPALIGLLRY